MGYEKILDEYGRVLGFKLLSTGDFYYVNLRPESTKPESIVLADNCFLTFGSDVNGELTRMEFIDYANRCYVDIKYEFVGFDGELSVEACEYEDHNHRKVFDKVIIQKFDGVEAHEGLSGETGIDYSNIVVENGNADTYVQFIMDVFNRTPFIAENTSFQSARGIIVQFVQEVVLTTINYIDTHANRFEVQRMIEELEQKKAKLYDETKACYGVLAQKKAKLYDEIKACDDVLARLSSRSKTI